MSGNFRVGERSARRRRFVAGVLFTTVGCGSGCGADLDSAEVSRALAALNDRETYFIGANVDRGEDCDGDGIEDYALAFFEYHEDCPGQRGALALLSGADLRPIRSLPSTTSDPLLGSLGIALVADQEGDRSGDLVVASLSTSRTQGPIDVQLLSGADWSPLAARRCAANAFASLIGLETWREWQAPLALLPGEGRCVAILSPKDLSEVDRIGCDVGEDLGDVDRAQSWNGAVLAQYRVPVALSPEEAPFPLRSSESWSQAWVIDPLAPLLLVREPGAFGEKEVVNYLEKDGLRIPVDDLPRHAEVVVPLDDVDRKGSKDFCATYWSPFSSRSKVCAFSSETGELLWDVSYADVFGGRDPSERFGMDACLGRDHDGDGLRDLFVAFSTDAEFGAVVCSASNGSKLASWSRQEPTVVIDESEE